MKAFVLSLTVLFCLSICAAHRSEALQAMTDADLSACTAQAGMDMAVADLVVYHHMDSLSFISKQKIDEDTTISTPLTLSNTKSLLTLNAGIEDINKNDFIDPITFDIGMLSDLGTLYRTGEDPFAATTIWPSDVLDRPVIALRAPDWERNLEIRNSGISLNGTDLGSFSLQGSKMQGWELFLAAGQIYENDPSREAGMDFEFAFHKHIDAFTYSPSESQTLSFQNIYFSENMIFSRLDPDNPDSEITGVTSASGFFRLGNMREGKPLSIDMGVTDEGRSEATPVLRLDLKEASGSFAIASIQDTSTGTERNFGPLIAQGIKIHHMVVEFPGRNFP